MSGCVITGNMSDAVGRKPVVICCLLGTIVSHLMVARSTTLGGVALGRIIGGVTGGMTPIAQAAVADVVRGQSSAPSGPKSLFVVSNQLSRGERNEPAKVISRLRNERWW